jgi:hypothetical protein
MKAAQKAAVAAAEQDASVARALEVGKISYLEAQVTDPPTVCLQPLWCKVRRMHVRTATW